jgi:hypothetical protein
MTKEAKKLGLTPMDEDREVFNVLAETNTFIEARYLVTFEALNRTCDSLREGVGRILRKNGVMIRL